MYSPLGNQKSAQPLLGIQQFGLFFRPQFNKEIKMTARIYIVEDAGTDEKFLVKATTQAQAIRHVAKARYDCEVASSLDVAELMKNGSVVEDATQ